MTGRKSLLAMMQMAALGGVSFLLNIAVTVGGHNLIRWSEETSFATGLATVMVVNFLSCRYIIFGARHGSWWRQFGAFVASSLLFRGSEFLAFLLVHTWLGVHYVAAIVGILGASFVAKFIFFKNVVFRTETEAV